MRERGKIAMCAGGNSEISRASLWAGNHHESARCGERVIDAGDPDVGGRAGCLQFLAFGEGGVDLRESRDPAFAQKRRIRRDGALLSQQFRDRRNDGCGIANSNELSAQVFELLAEEISIEIAVRSEGFAMRGPAGGLLLRMEEAGPTALFKARRISPRICSRAVMRSLCGPPTIDGSCVAPAPAICAGWPISSADQSSAATG